MAWLMVLAAGLFETGFAVALKLSHGMTRLGPTIIFAACALPRRSASSTWSRAWRRAARPGS
jgi:multidrug transporter EmrE-like cation transporter